KLSPDKTYLVHEDGTPFFWFADTWWYGGSGRTTLEEFEILVKDRAQKGFTVVQLVVGVPPETDTFSDDAANSGGLPFNKDLTINKNYFNEIDTKIRLLIENGLVPCIVGGWGHQINTIGIEPLKKLWDEILARYAKYPVIFCLCGEANLTAPYIPGFPQTEKNKQKLFSILKTLKLFTLAQKTKRHLMYLYLKKKEAAFINKNIKLWNELAEYIQSKNTHKRPLTVHVRSDITANNLFHNPSWLTINTIQSGHAKESLPFMIASIKQASETTLQPIINMEPWYEGIGNNFDEYYQRLAFWACILSGAKGHTYGAHGIWQMAKNGDNFMEHWGKSDWKKALQQQGAAQLGNAVAFLKQYEWWKLRPDFSLVVPEWTEKKPYQPVAATIDNKIYFIYIPNKNMIQSKLTIIKQLRNEKVFGYLPDILKQIPIVYENSTITIPKTDTKDLLLIITL
ncbi:MAG TPA: DUF4038 domain-containing protein, partial [Patescibacteria group bacterium]|nr:DUF4038 domain-containing protein [Patescibacteria group bacterium]